MKKRVFFVLLFLCLQTQTYYNAHELMPTFFHYELSKNTKKMLSHKTTAALHTFFTKNHTPCSARQLAQEIKHEFPFIQSIRYSYRNDNTYHFSFSCTCPDFLVNNELTISGNQITPKDWWSEELLEKLKSLSIKEVKPQEHWITLLSTLDEMIYQDYAVTWNSQFEIYLKKKSDLKDKKNPSSITFLATTSTTHELLSSSPVTYCNQIVKERLSQSKSKGSQADWIIDVRFKNQIIISQGEKHEKIIST